MEGRSLGADGTAVGRATSARQERPRALEQKTERESVDQAPPARPSAVGDGTSFVAGDGVFAPTASTEREEDQSDDTGKPKKTTGASASTPSTGSTYEERLHSKLSQSTETGKPKKLSAASTSSGSTFEERLHSKLSQSTETGKPTKTFSASTSSGSTFEERLHSKLSQSAETGKPTKTSTASTSSGSTFEERLHNKLSSSASLRRQASQRNYQLYQLLRVVHSRNACTVNSTSLPMPPSQLSRFRTMSATHQGHIRLSLTGR